MIHGHRIIHGDIKPESILVSAAATLQHRVHIVDFEVAQPFGMHRYFVIVAALHWFSFFAFFSLFFFWIIVFCFFCFFVFFLIPFHGV